MLLGSRSGIDKFKRGLHEQGVAQRDVTRLARRAAMEV